MVKSRTVDGKKEKFAKRLEEFIIVWYNLKNTLKYFFVSPKVAWRR